MQQWERQYLNPTGNSENAFQKSLGWPQSRWTDNEAGKVNGYRPGPCAKTDVCCGDGLITFRYLCFWLFNDAFNFSDYRASNDLILNERG